MSDALSATFSALADPTRRAILQRLARGQATVGMLAGPFAISAPAISRHLKVLERAHLIHRERDAQRHICRLGPAPLRQAAGWIEQYRSFWEERLDALGEYLKETRKETSHGRKGRRTRERKGERRKH
jgi:DNA-binding transcriptional ArsR family regulator